MKTKRVTKRVTKNNVVFILQLAKHRLRLRKHYYVCSAIWGAARVLYNQGREDWYEVGACCMQEVSRAIRPHVTVTSWLEDQTPSVVLTDDECYEYRLAWIDQMIELAKAGKFPEKE